MRVVARLANSVLREAMALDNGPGAILDVADLAAPSVVEACLARTTHPIAADGIEFVITETDAPRDATLRELHGDLAPVAVIRGENSPNPGEVVTCPSRDLVTNHTTTVAHIHEPSPSMRSPLVKIDARISETSVETRPMPPRNADAYRLAILRMNGDRIAWASANNTTATMKPEADTDTPGTNQAATKSPIAADPRKIAARSRSSTMALMVGVQAVIPRTFSALSLSISGSTAGSMSSVSKSRRHRSD